MKKLLLIILITFFIVGGIFLFYKFFKYKNNESLNTYKINESTAENNSIVNSEDNQINENLSQINSNQINNNVTEDNEIKNNSKEENLAIVENPQIKEEKTKKIENNAKRTIAIDPGHQAKGDSSQEPIGPGAKETKAKVTTGATGNFTKQKESELVLKIALLLEKRLKDEEYNVVMTRTTNNVNISNSERAKIANDSNADAFIRIHADSYDDSSINRNIHIVPN